MNWKLSIITGFYICLLPVLASAQFQSNYDPINCEGPLPDQFQFDPQKAMKNDIKQTEIFTSKDKAKIFFSRSSDLKKRLFESGSIYFNNQLSSYIQSVTERVLQSQPEILEKVDIYLTRNVKPNAYALSDGTIFFNIGLLSKLNNHHEVALIIAHEAAHVIKQHAAKDYERLSDIQEQNTNNNELASAFRQLQYSKDSEFDADGLGVRIVLQSNFNAKKSVGALKNLNVIDTTINNTTEISFDKYFNTDYFTIDSSWVTSDNIDDAREDFQDQERFQLLSNEIEDIYKSHPDIQKRIIAAREIIEASTIDQKPVNSSNLTLPDFDDMKQTVLFEMIENNMRFSNYVHSIYYSLRLLEDYPDNTYLATSLAKSLYWTGYYKEIKDGELGLKEPYTTSDQNFFKLYAIFSEANISQAQKLSYSFTKKMHKQFPDSPELLFYTAVNTEKYVGKNAAYSYFSKYKKQYPEGTFIPFVKKKIKAIE